MVPNNKELLHKVIICIIDVLNNNCLCNLKNDYIGCDVIILDDIWMRECIIMHSRTLYTL